MSTQAIPNDLLLEYSFTDLPVIIDVSEWERLVKLEKAALAASHQLEGAMPKKV